MVRRGGIKAGDYWQRFTRLIVTETASTTSNQFVQSWSDASTYWGYLTYGTAEEPVKAGARREIVSATINILGFPDFDHKDRIRDEGTGITFDITGITYDFLQTILNVRSVVV